jgi:hypothetical protein
MQYMQLSIQIVGFHPKSTNVLDISSIITQQADFLLRVAQATDKLRNPLLLLHTPI